MTVGKVGKAHPAASKPGIAPVASKPGTAPVAAHPAPAPVAAAKSPREEYKEIINAWAHMIPVALVNKLDDFFDKHLSKAK